MAKRKTANGGKVRNGVNNPECSGEVAGWVVANERGVIIDKASEGIVFADYNRAELHRKASLVRGVANKSGSRLRVCIARVRVTELTTPKAAPGKGKRANIKGAKRG